MFVIQAFLHTKADRVDEFKQACIVNARASLNEPGCKRFDVIQQLDDPTRFGLVEVYRTAEDLEFHKTQEHYLTWKRDVEDMQAEPRYAVKYASVYPPDEAF